jgi:enterochelin esterase family protein
MNSGQTISSPRIAALQRALAQGDRAALDLFWQEMALHSSPIIEPIPGDQDNSLVTFVWRGQAESEGVALVNSFSGRDSADTMSRLPGSDLWYITFVLRNDLRESYQFAVEGKNVTDPFNPHRHVFPDDPELGFTGWVSSVLELPAAPPQPWSDPRPGVPKGRLDFHRLPSAGPGDDYRVWVYTPPSYRSDGSSYGYLLALDGWFYVNLIPTPTILDNLIAEGRLPPLVAILVGGVFDKTRQRDLACHEPFADFLTRELLPWARRSYHLSEDPAQNVIVGVSLGGLMAAFVGLHHSGIFGNVLAQSAFFGWKPRGEGEDEWIARQYILSPLLPLRFYIEAGLLETNIQTIEPGWNNFLVGARYMRDVLRSKGYTVHYSEFAGGHNPMNWRGTLADGLLSLLGGGSS